jgi:uncharacterized membrane protein YkoI
VLQVVDARGLAPCRAGLAANYGEWQRRRERSAKEKEAAPAAAAAAAAAAAGAAAAATVAARGAMPQIREESRAAGSSDHSLNDHPAARLAASKKLWRSQVDATVWSEERAREEALRSAPGATVLSARSLESSPESPGNGAPPAAKRYSV